VVSRVGKHVIELRRSAIKERASHHETAHWYAGKEAVKPGRLIRGQVVSRHQMQESILAPGHGTELGLAQRRGPRDYGVEGWLHIGRGGRDDAQDLRGSGLLFE